MAAQSFAMGHAFGTSFQYGKRKISSMSNEEFNKLDSVALHASLQADIRAMIPSMNESFHRMESFQIEIIQSMLATIIKSIDAFGQFLSGGGNEGTGKDFGQFGNIDFTGNPELAAHEQAQGHPEWIQHAHGSDTGFTPTPTPTTQDTSGNAKANFETAIMNSSHHFWRTDSQRMASIYNQYLAMPPPHNSAVRNVMLKGITAKQLDEAKQIAIDSGKADAAERQVLLDNIAKWQTAYNQQLKNIPGKGYSIKDLRARAQYAKAQLDGHNAALRKYKSLLLDAIKKLQNYDTLQKNR